jgi:hypothetical protein
MISNENVINYKVLYLFEWNNYALGRFFHSRYFEKRKKENKIKKNLKT